MKLKRFSQLVLVEADTCGPYLERLVSKKKITLARAALYYEEKEGFDWERDGITFIDKPTIIKMD